MGNVLGFRIWFANLYAINKVFRLTILNRLDNTFICLLQRGETALDIALRNRLLEVSDFLLVHCMRNE